SGHQRPDQARDPRRAGRARRADALRDLHPARDEARHRGDPPGDQPAPCRARGGRPGAHQPIGPIQVPQPRHDAAARDRGAVAIAGRHEEEGPMKIDVTSIHVDDQAKALAFYTEVLGFLPKTDLPAGEHRWLTVVSPEAPDGVELSLEPN